MMKRRTTGAIPRGTEYHEEPLTSKKQTGRKMYAIVERFHNDLRTTFSPDGRVPLADLPMEQFFSLVKNIPYRKDEKPVEVLARPAHILRFARLGMDCKKKNSLMAAFLRCQESGAYPNGIPYRFVASSRRADKRVHHVFCQAKLNGHWSTLDPTYAWYEPGAVKEVTYAEVLLP